MDFYKFIDRLIEGWQINVSVSLLLVYLFGQYNAAIGPLYCLVVLDWLTK